MHCEVFQWASCQIQLRGHSCPEKKNSDGSVFHYMQTLLDYLALSLPDMAQISLSTVWVPRSPGWNWTLSFSVLVRKTAHFLSKLTTKFSHKMVSGAFWHLFHYYKIESKKWILLQYLILSRLYITLRHTKVIIGGTGSIYAYSRGSWCTCRGYSAN